MTIKNLKKKPGGNGPKRAGIIVRVSSAEQAIKKNKETGETESKFSPELQEKDCREHCQRRGHVVVAVYYDIDKYRDAHGRLVEPSGTRSDRPGLKQALADIDAGKIDVLVGWRQDRLVRGITRALIELKERVTEGKVEIELAKEQFNLATFEVLAWAAGVELQAKHDRLLMGVSGRLASGKAWNMPDPYGYKVVDGIFEVEPVEASWITKVWKWYGDGVSVKQIRRRLIAGSAPQKGRNHKHAWRIEYIRTLLRRDYYQSGTFEMNWNGETYKLQVPTIIDAAMAKKVKERRARFKQYPAGGLKQEGLGSGLVYCAACNIRMATLNKHVANHVRGRAYSYDYRYYVCWNRHEGIVLDGCAAWVMTGRIDSEIWAKIWGLISIPGRLERAIEQRISTLKQEEATAVGDCREIEAKIAALLDEEQTILGWAAKKKFSESVINTRLDILAAERSQLENSLADKRLLVGKHADKLRELAAIYRENVLAGAKEINTEPKTAEETRLQFEARRRLIRHLVTRVDVLGDKSIRVQTEIDFGVLPTTDVSVY